MATATKDFDIPLKAAADLSSYQFHAVEISANRTVNVCNGAGDLVVGILQNKPSAAGEGATVRIGGTSKVVAGAAITAGARIGTDASGHLVAKTSDADLTIGIAVEAATASGDIIEAIICPGTQRAS